MSIRRPSAQLLLRGTTFVTPAKAGVHLGWDRMDSRLRGGDEELVGE